MPYDADGMKPPHSALGKMEMTVIPSEGRNLAVPRRLYKLKILALFGAIAFLCLPLSASAQGCALCYTTVSAAGSAAIRALHFGILAVLIPALTLFLSILFMLFRRAAAEPA
jgi:hypothetical protein